MFSTENGTTYYHIHTYIKDENGMDVRVGSICRRFNDFLKLKKHISSLILPQKTIFIAADPKIRQEKLSQ